MIPKIHINNINFVKVKLSDFILPSKYHINHITKSCSMQLLHHLIHNFQMKYCMIQQLMIADLKSMYPYCLDFCSNNKILIYFKNHLKLK